jgi:hypothetical protein
MAAALLWLAAVASLHGGAARAEMAGEDYVRHVAPPPRTPAAQQALEEELARERREAQRREQERRVREQRLASARRAWHEQQPPGARALGQYCTRCHTLDVVIPSSRASIGWAWTLLRMQWHGANMPWQPALDIWRHLVQCGALGLPPLDPMPDDETLLRSLESSSLVPNRPGILNEVLPSKTRSRTPSRESAPLGLCDGS